MDKRWNYVLGSCSLCVLPFCYLLKKGRCIHFLITAVALPQASSAYLLSYSSEVRSPKWSYRAEGDLSAGPRGLWPSPAFRRRLYALEHCPALLSHQFQPLHPSLTLLHPSYSNTCNYVRAIQIILDNLISRLNLPIPVKSPLLCGNTWRHNGGVWGLRLKHAGEGSRKTSPSRATSESDPRPASSFPSSVWRQRLQVMTPCSEF